MYDAGLRTAEVALPTVVVSDVHLGSPYCRYGAFQAFLNSLPENTSLVLNGDTIDKPGERLPPEGMVLVEELAADFAGRVVVIRGNHDENDQLLVSRGLSPVESVAVPAAGTYICHGDQFHLARRHHNLFVSTFRALHRLRVRLGAAPIHVAQYAKKWGFFYKILRHAVRDNAIQFARENGYRTIVCGHVHFPEDSLSDGIRYVNTGCWTESPSHYLAIQRDSATLHSRP